MTTTNISESSKFRPSSAHIYETPPPKRPCLRNKNIPRHPYSSSSSDDDQNDIIMSPRPRTPNFFSPQNLPSAFKTHARTITCAAQRICRTMTSLDAKFGRSKPSVDQDSTENIQHYNEFPGHPSPPVTTPTRLEPDTLDRPFHVDLPEIEPQSKFQRNRSDSSSDIAKNVNSSDLVSVHRDNTRPERHTNTGDSPNSFFFRTQFSPILSTAYNSLISLQSRDKFSRHLGSDFPRSAPPISYAARTPTSGSPPDNPTRLQVCDTTTDTRTFDNLTKTGPTTIRENHRPHNNHKPGAMRISHVKSPSDHNFAHFRPADSENEPTTLWKMIC